MPAHRVVVRRQKVKRRRWSRGIALAATATTALAVGGILLGPQWSPTRSASSADGTPAVEDASRTHAWRQQQQQRSATPQLRPTTPAAQAPTPVTSQPVAPPSTSTAAPSARATTPAPSPLAARPVANTGTAAPQGDLDNWRQVFVDNFDGTSLGSQWRTYDGKPGGSDYGRWDSSHVSVSGGNLVLTEDRQGGEWVAGGLASRIDLTYGKVEMRYRVEASDEMKYAALLWPADDSWPPEIDFAEDAGGNRSGTTATLHYGGNNTMVNERVKADFTQWHTVGIEWTPGRVVYTLDGSVWATTVNPNVSDVPMNLAIQVQPGGCRPGLGDAFGCGVGNPNATRLQVDWVTIYVRA